MDIRVNDTIPLNITEFETFNNSNPVPEPSTILLLSLSMAGLLGFKMYNKTGNK
ncbi:PEP-CTERM sorting domain-containing protein [Candidatus Desantisbacteria bacterium]|nr:PEP-CTERM sorting domain-containing protein [Candidatus Desantisbacteria bacterium]